MPLPDGYEEYGQISRSELEKDALEGQLRKDGIALPDEVHRIVAGYDGMLGLVVAEDEDGGELGRKGFQLEHEPRFGLDMEDVASMDEATNDLIKEVADGGA